MSNAEKISPGTALYYPYIHPREIDHLKAALIYWDRVRRIVPRPVLEGKYVYDDKDDARLLADYELLVATRPEPYEERAAQKFFEHVEPQSANFRIDIATARDLAQRNQGIHIEKFGHSVIKRLHKLGLAHRFGDWVFMHDEVGAFYMFCLASEMSDRMGAPLFSDSIDDAVLGESLLFEPSSAADVSDVLLRVGIRLPSPEELRNVSVSKFAEFAIKRSGERQNFRKAIEGIVETARSAADPNAINDYLASQRSTITEAVNNHRAALDELNVGAVSSIAKITVPAGAAAAIAALPLSPIAAAAFAGIGIAVSAISCYAETRGKLRQARTSSPYHYLTSIERTFGVNVVSQS